MGETVDNAVGAPATLLDWHLVEHVFGGHGGRRRGSCRCKDCFWPVTARDATRKIDLGRRSSFPIDRSK
jgi:hypothetical protein